MTAVPVRNLESEIDTLQQAILDLEEVILKGLSLDPDHTSLISEALNKIKATKALK